MQTTTVGRPMEILLVEDNRLDIRVTMEALRGGMIQHRLTIVCDGEEAIEFLKQNGRFVRAPRPDLILLDLLLPKKNGLELLEEIKSDEHLKTIPIVVLTSSHDDDNRSKCQFFHVDSYITKPVNFEKFLVVIKELKKFWMHDVLLPAMEE